MRNWPKVTLSSVAMVFNGKTPATVEQRPDGLPVLKIRDVSEDGRFRGKFESFVDEEFGFRYKNKCVEAGDVLILNAAHNADYVGSKLFFADQSVVGSYATGEWTVVRAKLGKLNPSFIYRYLQSPLGRAAIKANVRGIHLYPSDVEGIEMPLPQLLEQERIVQILEAADALRRLRNQANDRMEAVGSALFSAMFASAPPAWPRQKLGDLGSLDRGKSRHRPRDEPSLFGGPYPFIQTGDVSNCSWEITEFTQTYSELGLAQSRLWPAGTLCITIAANIGKTGILGFDACFPDSVVGFVPGNRVRVEFIQYWLRTLQARLEEEAPQAAQKNINLQTLRELDLAVPPLSLQNEFAERIGEIRGLLKPQAATERRLNDLFQSLLQRAFQGEL